MTKFYFLLMAASLVVISCKTADKSFRKGEYLDAIELGLKKLQKDPYDGETKEIVKSAYTLAVAQHEDEIRILSNSRNENRFDKIFQQYVILQDLYMTVRSSPQAIAFLQPRDYSGYVETYREKAADVHYQKGLKWMEEGNKEGYREAYYAFKTALRYKPDNMDLHRLTEESYDRALTKIQVVTMDQYYSGYQSSFAIRNFQDDIIRTLSHNLGTNGFVRFYSEWEARNQHIVPDQILELQLSRVTIGQPYDETSSRDVSKDVVVKEIVYKPDSVVKEYAKVYARITTTRRNLLSEAELMIRIRDTYGRTLWTDRFTGSHRWQESFVSYTGDERALSESDRNAGRSSNRQQVPDQDEILRILFNQIHSDLSSRLRSYYTRYR